MRRFCLVPTLAIALSCGMAHAAVLYKLTDPAGRITFADAVPNGFHGEVVRIDVDTSTNAVAPVRPAPETLSLAARADAALAARRLEAAGRADRVTLARQRVDAAQAALDNARDNSLPTDWIYAGHGPGGVPHRFPNPEYATRLERLENELAAVQANLAAAERDSR